MDLSLTPDEAAFRAEARAFVEAHFPPERPYRATPQDRRRWADALLERGWEAYTWPKDWGGPGWTATQRYLWERETVVRGVPARLGGMGMMMLAPVLHLYGTPEQKARHLPGILEDRVEWCQGYSEPGAGSDLASLSTRAESDGEDYVVTGEKVWTSWAQVAHWMFALVRTSREARRQDGITFLLIDMSAPGVAVSPIHTMDGQHHVNRVVLDGVRVPKANRVGAEGAGWRCAKALLEHERTGLASVSESLRLMALLKRIADPALNAKIAALEIELQALETSELRVMAAIDRTGAPGPESSILKLRGTQVLQAITALFVEAAGPHAAPWLPEIWSLASNAEPVGPDWAQRETIRYLMGRTASIAGGSDEVQRNIIAKHVLGL